MNACNASKIDSAASRASPERAGRTRSDHRAGRLGKCRGVAATPMAGRVVMGRTIAEAKVGSKLLSRGDQARRNNLGNLSDPEFLCTLMLIWRRTLPVFDRESAPELLESEPRDEADRTVGIIIEL